MTGDMHCHTTMSDGSTSPEMLVQYALDAGLDFIAVTDHDTMAGASYFQYLTAPRPQTHCRVYAP